MRMRVKWYKVGVDIDTEGSYHLREIPHIKGRYCKRNEVESVLERINEQISDSTDNINHLINDIFEIKSRCDTSLKGKCDSVIKKLGDLRHRTKKCKRPKKEDISDFDAMELELEYI